MQMPRFLRTGCLSERKLLGQSEPAAITEREREGHAELARLLEQAIRCLESMDLCGANEALRKASVEPASSQDDARSTEYAGTGPSAGSEAPVRHTETRGTQPRLGNRG